MRLKSWIAWQGSDIVYGFLSRILWPRASAGALIVNEGSVLAVDMRNYLMLPSGGLDYGESFKEAAIRETLEETGYSIKSLEKLSDGVNSSGGKEIIFEAKIAEKEKIDSEGWGEPIWILYDEVNERNWRYNRDIGKLLKRKQN